MGYLEKVNSCNRWTPSRFVPFTVAGVQVGWLRLDRGFAPAFGVRAYGVHVNGFQRRKDGLHLWIGTRATDRMIKPGKLDNMVAGGQPAGLSLIENVIKECEEEASISARRAKRSIAASVITYACERDGGLRADTLFSYDLEMRRMNDQGRPRKSRPLN